MHKNATAYATRIGLLAAGIALGATAAMAGPNADALKKSGLVGRWASDCSQPVSMSNNYVTYAVTGDGRATERVEMAEGDKDRTTEMKNVTVQSDGRVSYEALEDGENLKMVIQIDGTRHRTWRSETVGDPSGEDRVYIEDGKLKMTGGDAVWSTRCGK